MAIPKAIEHMRSGSGGLEIIPIISTDGLTYTGTAKSIKEYKDGMIIGLITNMNNIATNPITNITININNLGALKLTQYYIKKDYSTHVDYYKKYTEIDLSDQIEFTIQNKED